ncbi:GNAT family N-acetyltransferase [Vallitalea maricola]|uniref:Uncharacterized protein n=1 Tax=Vallitalea maricola TaxID=3074433 RepID=A0ACB5UCR9_9FIRM|nr:hypothetical protein AN2V17_00100 [Vallitalea sp. AN17-2]
MNNNLEKSFEKCTPKDYEELLLVINDAFMKEEDNWFVKHLPHIFPDIEHATEKEIANTRILKINQKIVGCIGIYPVDLEAVYKGSRINLSVGGIGTVCILKDYRNKGLMSYMLKEIIKMMDDEGYDISWLTGDRHRYKNYGWDYSGRTCNFSIEHRQLAKLIKNTDKNIRLASAEDIPMLNTLYNQYQNKVSRTIENWKINLIRKNITINCCNDNGGKGYMIYEKNNPNYILELQGDKEHIESLLINHMVENDLQEMTVFYPYENSKVLSCLNGLASNLSISHCDQIKIINTQKLWDKLYPMIKTQWDEENMDISNYGEDDKKTLLESIFAFDYFDREDNGIRIEPINWWMSNIDKV